MLQLSSGQSQHTALMLINVYFSDLMSVLVIKKIQHNTWITWFCLQFDISLLSWLINHDAKMSGVFSARSNIY